MELRLGEKQTLVIVKKVEFGVYLATKEAPEDKVLLPAKQVPEGAKVGDELEVFLYRDSSDRLISTTRTPKLCMGQVALLTVVQVGKVGAFLDWGLEKDLLLPFKQQTRKVKTGEQVLAALYIDKSGTEAKGKKCPNCGNETLVYQEGCLICKTCGASRCG